MGTPEPVQKKIQPIVTPEPVQNKIQQRRVRFLDELNQTEPTWVTLKVTKRSILIKPKRQSHLKRMPMMTMINVSEKNEALRLIKASKWGLRQIIHGWWN